MTVKAVGFDLDYTLAVPDRDRSRLLADAVESVGAAPISREAYLEAHRRNLTGETRAPIFEDLLEGRDAAGSVEEPADGEGDRIERDGSGESDTGGREVRGSDTNVRAVDLAREYRRAINDSLVPVPGVEEMIAALRERYRVGLLTNGPTVAQRGKLSTLGWTDTFDATVVTGELAAGKPDAAAFEALLDALEAAPEETVYVGDEVEADVGGAAAAGIAVVQVVFEGGPDPDPRADVHLRRDDLARDLPSILETL